MCFFDHIVSCGVLLEHISETIVLFIHNAYNDSLFWGRITNYFEGGAIPPKQLPSLGDDQGSAQLCAFKFTRDGSTQAECR